MQVAGVLASAWFVWVNSIAPRLGLPSPGSAVARALTYVALAWICGAVTTFCVYFVVSMADFQLATRFSVRSSAPAMWFAPAIVLLPAPFDAAIVVSLLLVANATRLLIFQWGAIESPMAMPFGAAWIASATAQAGLIAMLWHHPFLAAALLAVSTAILTSLSVATGAYVPGKPPAMPHSALSVVMTFLLAAALTLGGIAYRGRGGTRPSAAPAGENVGFDGDFPGVILLPELKPYTRIFVPAPVTPGKLGLTATNPVGIPFSGEYWMFRWPAERPPRRSAIRRGNAAELSFHTTDGRPLEMEAIQRLDRPVDIRCCREIQIAVHNDDQYPGTVSLELVLIDTSVAINVTQKLGTVAVGAPTTGEQVLRFWIPRVTALRRFDEITVLFRRARVRADRSARIAILRFVLAP